MNQYPNSTTNDFWSPPPSYSPYGAPGPYGFDPNISTFHPDPMPFETPDGQMNGSSIDNEPPLLEELGINFEHIVQKTISVLNPFRKTDPAIIQDADLAGPLVFGLAFGSFLLLSGKVHFSYIYGFGVMGCIMIHLLLKVMTPAQNDFSILFIISVLGYCLLPMVLLSVVAIFFTLQGALGNIMAGFVILWCALSASKLFTTALGMQNQQPLVAYPCITFYGPFALLTLF